MTGRIEVGFVWEKIVMGVWPFPILDEIPDVNYAIKQIVLDFYTVEAEDIARQRRTQNEDKFLTDRQTEMEPTNNIKDPITKEVISDPKGTLGKAKEQWFLQFLLGVKADVYVEKFGRYLDTIFDEKFSRSKEIQSNRFRASPCMEINEHERD